MVTDSNLNHPSFKVEHLALSIGAVLSCIHTSSLKGFCVRGRVKSVYNIYQCLNYKLKLLVELVY